VETASAEPDWHVQPADVAAAHELGDEFCAAIDDDAVEIDHAVAQGIRLVARTWERADISDVRIESCDLAGLNASSATLRRLELIGSRLRDSMVAGSMLQDITATECTAERLSLRFSTLQRVVFRNCPIAGTDFYGATFDKVWFDGCDLSDAQFDNVTVRSLRISNSTLLGVTGALSLTGAVLDLDDLPALAPSLAREVGITLVNP
jgi:uncharacterized protein YjbI with pentapeptide repeats